MRKQTAQANGTPWQVAGADGPLDRSAISLGMVDVTSTMAAQTAIDIPFMFVPGVADDIQRWLGGQQLSLILVPTSTSGTLYTKATEHAGGGPLLTINACR